MLINKKILFVTPYFPPGIGGVQKYVYNISQGLNKKYNWEISVITSGKKGGKVTFDKFKNLRVYRLPYIFKISNTPINPLWYYQIKRIIKKEAPDIINGHTPVPYISDIACMVKGDIPFITTYHNDLVKSNMILKSLIKLYYLLLGNNTLKKSSKIITTSSYYANNSLNLQKHLNKVFIVSPGVDIKLFNSKSIYTTDIIKKNQTVLFVGQLDKTHTHKGLTYLIDAIALVSVKIPSIKLIIVGSGDYSYFYKKYAQRKNILSKIVFAGLVREIDLPKYYGLSTVLVLPSYDQAEGFGMTLIEANASKRPVIGTKVGGIPSVIFDKKNGFLVKPKNSKELAKAIITIIKNPKLAQKMGENGYKIVKENYTWERQINRTHKIFEEINFNK